MTTIKWQTLDMTIGARIFVSSSRPKQTDTVEKTGYTQLKLYYVHSDWDLRRELSPCHLLALRTAPVGG